MNANHQTLKAEHIAHKMQALAGKHSRDHDCYGHISTLPPNGLLYSQIPSVLVPCLGIPVKLCYSKVTRRSNKQWTNAPGIPVRLSNTWAVREPYALGPSGPFFSTNAITCSGGCMEESVSLGFPLASRCGIHFVSSRRSSGRHMVLTFKYIVRAGKVSQRKSSLSVVLCVAIVMWAIIWAICLYKQTFFMILSCGVVQCAPFGGVKFQLTAMQITAPLHGLDGSLGVRTIQRSQLGVFFMNLHTSQCCCIDCACMSLVKIGSPTSGLKQSPGPRGKCLKALYMYSLLVAHPIQYLLRELPQIKA